MFLRLCLPVFDLHDATNEAFVLPSCSRDHPLITFRIGSLG